MGLDKKVNRSYIYNMSKAKRKTTKSRPSVVQKAEQMRREGKASEARAYLKDNLKSLNKPGLERDYIDGLSVFSDLLRGTDDSAGSMKFLKKALQLAKKHDFQELVGEITKKRAFLYLLLDQYRESFDDAQAALAISREQENKPLEIGALAVLGHLHEVRKERPKALVWFRQAMKLATEINDTWRRAGLYHDLGRIHGELREYLVGLDYLEQGEQYCLKNKYMNRYHMMIRAQGDIYKAIGDLGRARKLYDLSHSDPDKIDNLSEKLDNSTRFGHLYV
jgi:tetratricopeptide (TPR) repeat protein